MINVIGLGYIGLPTALMLAASGNEVIGTEIDEERVKVLQEGVVPFEEKGMPELMAEAISNNVTFSTEYHASDMYIITVPTPYDQYSKKIDPSYIQNAVRTVIDVALDDATIVVESTVSPGTIDKHVRPIIENGQEYKGKTFNLVHAPERILPGNMVHELRHNSRTIGTDNEEAGQKVKELYETFCEADIVITDIRTAEMSKVVENTYRDINIAFANELAKIAHFDNLDVNEIIRIANKHPRVNILNPGPGVGGHCISVDPWFLVGDYPELTDLIKTARDINDSMPSFVLKRIREVMDETGINDISKVGLYGLTYKANVDDTRESPTLQLLELQRQSLAEPLKVYDPEVSRYDITKNQYENFEEFLDDTEIIVLMVGHNHIKENKEMLEGKVVIDAQNIVKSRTDKIYKMFGEEARIVEELVPVK